MQGDRCTEGSSVENDSLWIYSFLLNKMIVDDVDVLVRVFGARLPVADPVASIVEGVDFKSCSSVFLHDIAHAANILGISMGVKNHL